MRVYRVEGSLKWERSYSISGGIVSAASGDDALVTYSTAAELSVADISSGAVRDSYTNILPPAPFAGMMPPASFVSVTFLGEGRFLALDHRRAAGVVYDLRVAGIRPVSIPSLAQESAAGEQRFLAALAAVRPGSGAPSNSGVVGPLPLVIWNVAPGRPGCVRLLRGTFDPVQDRYYEYDGQLALVGTGTLMLPRRPPDREKVPLLMAGSARCLLLAYRDGAVAAYQL
jgi:hypothetical protein